MKSLKKPFARLVCGIFVLIFFCTQLCACGMDLDALVFGLFRDAPGVAPVQPLETTPGEVIDPNGRTTGDKNHILVMENGRSVRLTTLRVIEDSMPLYAGDSTDSAVVKHYRLGALVTVEISNDSMWRVYEGEKPVGYCEIDKVLYQDAVYYGELPEEAETVYNPETARYFTLTSHLVDVRKYNDLLPTQMIISMNLSAEENAGVTPVLYERNLCMLQYDTLMKLLQAQTHFLKYGYTIKICDAYRPESVQNRFADAVGEEAWVAHTNGDGSAHTRGAAVDISLVSVETGMEVELPAPLYVFDAAGTRADADTWTSGVAYNINSLMTPIMEQAGFTASELWWHYEDSRASAYLSTDHAIDRIPLVSAD